MDDWRVDRRKILDNPLNERSASGAAKNRFFRSGGFTPGHWEVMRDTLIGHPKSASLHDVDTTSRYGTKYIYRCQITTPNGLRPCILTVWQYRSGGYWLVTAYPFA